MTQITINISTAETFFKPPKKIYQIDDTWSLDLIDRRDFGPNNFNGRRYVLFLLDNFSEIGRTVVLKKLLKQ